MKRRQSPSHICEHTCSLVIWKARGVRGKAPPENFYCIILKLILKFIHIIYTGMYVATVGLL